MTNNIILVAQICIYNEIEKGNLDRCLDNLLRYCDHVVAYDDASTDGSADVAESYGCHVIRGRVNNQMEELAHKQAILEKSLELGATHLFWLDADEVLDRPGTLGGLRQLCEQWPQGLDAYSFPEINLWRSQTWQRLDSLFTKARFVRLWKVRSGIRFDVIYGVHKQLYPITIKKVVEAPFSIIHYGFWDYKKMLVKIGVDHLDYHGLQDCAEFGLDRKVANWLLDERECQCRKVPNEIFPPGCIPPDIWSELGPRRIDELVPYSRLLDEPEPPLVDARAMVEWQSLHDNGYHKNIHGRNLAVWTWPGGAPNGPSTLFGFDPVGKVVFDIGCGGGWHMLDCLRKGAPEVHGFEVDKSLIDRAWESFEKLGIPFRQYSFKCVDELDDMELPKADIIYSLATFMHIPFWQACSWFRWIARNLALGGEAHLQFYQAGNGRTMFWGGLATSPPCGDDVSDVRLHHELDRAGLRVIGKHLAEGPGILPVWQMYRCVKK